MSTRSMTPLTSCSVPIGISVATTCGPKAALSESSVRKKSARSRSSMFTKIRRAMSSSSARCHRRVVETSTPITALMTKTADSTTRRAPSASAMKLGSPGVSSRLTLRSIQWNELRFAEIDIWRACSSSSWSETVEPSTTDPRRLIAPAWKSSASCSEVFPLPRCPTSATFLMRSAGGCMTDLLSSDDAEARNLQSEVWVVAVGGEVGMVAPLVHVVRVDAGDLAQALEHRVAVAAPGGGAGAAPGEEPLLPLAGLEGRRPAEAHDRRPGLERDRLAVHGRVGQVHVGAGGGVERLAVEREAGGPAEDEVDLLVAVLELVVRLHDLLAGIGRGVGVRAEGPQAERPAHRAPGERARAGQGLHVVEVDDAVAAHSSSRSASSPCRRERRRRTALVCSCETRDSVTPSTSPISRSVRFS